MPARRAEVASAFRAVARRLRGKVVQADRLGLGEDVRRDVAHHAAAADELDRADLIWVTADMTALALDASHDVPEFDPAGLPTSNGLALFGAPLPAIATPPLYTAAAEAWSGQVPVWGLWWHPRDADTLAIDIITRAQDLPAGPAFRRTPVRYERTDSDRSGRTYSHRWVVRGHWAHQPYGPQQSLRKLIYREPYIKGPEGKPLRRKEHVSVWRRLRHSEELYGCRPYPNSGAK